MTRYHNIVVLTGAGISAESGLSTFRGDDGLWEQHRLEDVATPEAFRRDPDLVHRFYNMRRANLATVQPNLAHVALARLEREHAGKVLIVTQNVDDLHTRGGSKNILHMHGELESHEWPSYGGDIGGMRYSPLDEITPANVGQLRMAWEFHTGEETSNGRGELRFTTAPPWLARIVEPMVNCWLLDAVNNSMY